MEGLGHNALLFDERVARAVERRILDRRQSYRSQPGHDEGHTRAPARAG
jgi:hypothetical protein